MLLMQIRDGTFVRAAYFSQLDCDKALDARDGDPEFEACWLSAFEELENRWPSGDVSDSERAIALEIQHEGFLQVSRSTAQHEIASYVADDLDLLVRAKLIGLQSEFLDELWAA